MLVYCSNCRNDFIRFIMNKTFLISTSLLIASLSTYSQSSIAIEEPEISKNCFNNKKHFRAFVSLNDKKKNAKEILLIQALGAIQSKISTKVEVKDNKITLSKYLKMNNIEFTSLASSTTKEKDYDDSNVFRLIYNQHYVLYKITTSRKVTNKIETTTSKEEFSAPEHNKWYDDVVEELENIGFRLHSTHEENMYRTCISINRDLIKKE